MNHYEEQLLLEAFAKYKRSSRFAFATFEDFRQQFEYNKQRIKQGMLRRSLTVEPPAPGEPIN